MSCYVVFLCKLDKINYFLQNYTRLFQKHQSIQDRYAEKVDSENQYYMYIHTIISVPTPNYH